MSFVFSVVIAALTLVYAHGPPLPSVFYLPLLPHADLYRVLKAALRLLSSLLIFDISKFQMFFGHVATVLSNTNKSVSVDAALVADGGVDVGVEQVISVTGYFCKLCHKFYNNETMARINHCKTQTHFDKYLVRKPHVGLSFDLISLIVPVLEIL